MAENKEEQKKQEQYQSPWQRQIDDIVGKILNREKFSYDLNGDALYRQYADRYITQGKMAMLDTQGQTAALTGGYGNSYGKSAGQQAYQGYLHQLGDRIPQLYQLALSKYQAESDQLADQAAMLGSLEDQAYDRYAQDRDFRYQQDRDKAADSQWQAEFDENVRRFNFQHKLGEFASLAGGYGGNPEKKPPAGYDSWMEFWADHYRRMEEAAKNVKHNGKSPKDTAAMMK